MNGTVVADIPRTQFDIMGADTAADPFPGLAELREAGPVVWHETYQRWIVSNYREVRKIVTDHDHFVMAGTTAVALFGEDAFISIDDRKRHDRLRNIWTDPFRKQGLDALRPAIQAIIDRLLVPVFARINAGEAVDLSAMFFRPLPTMVIAEMMGVSEDKHADIVRWSDEMAGGGPAYLAQDDAARAALAAREAAKTALADFLIEQMDYRRSHPGNDLVSMLVNAEAAQGLPDDQLVQNLRQLLFAGNETTARWLGQIFVAYGERPEVQSALAADPDLIAPANDEVLRWAGVTGTLVRRVCGGPIDIGGVTMQDGDLVTLMLTGANRDPERFADPDTFDIHRAPAPHLAFGAGLHNCLGMALAKVECDMALRSFFAGVPRFHIAAPYTFSILPLRGPLPVVVALDT